MQHLQQAFHMIDAHVWVLQKLGKDIVDGKVEHDETGTLNFQSYYDRFNQSVRDAQAAAKAAKEAAESELVVQQQSTEPVPTGDQNG